MADLSEALDAALRDRYRVAEVKRPSTHRQGLTARMNQLEKLFSEPGDRKGAAGIRAAKAAGISPRTWQKWRAGTQEPSPRTLRKLDGAHVRLVTLPAFRHALKTKRIPNKVRVTATIKWSKSPRKQYNRTAERTTTLEGMRGTMAAVIRVWAGAGPEAAARALERGAAAVYSVADDEDGSPGIEFEGDEVEIEFP